MKTNKLGTFFIIGGLAAFPVAANAMDCTPNFNFSTVKEGVISVALTNTPPYSFEKNGEISGIDGELIKKFAANNCLAVEYEIYTYPAAVSSVQSKRADVGLGGFYRTAARERVVSLSDPVYLDQLAVVSEQGFSTVDQLMGKSVGTVEGYDWVMEMEDIFSESQTYPSSLNLAQDLHAGRIDAALEGFGAAVSLNGDSGMSIELLQPDPRITATVDASQTSFLLTKGNESFANAVNQSVAVFREKGVIAEVLSMYDLDKSAADVGEPRVIE